MGMCSDAIFYKCINRIQITQSPFMFIAGLFVFYIFESWEIESRKIGYLVIVSFLGKYSVWAYLLHGGPAFLRDWLWDDLFKAGYFYEKSSWEYAFHYGMCILALYFIGVVCEYIYGHIGKGYKASVGQKKGKLELSKRNM